MDNSKIVVYSGTRNVYPQMYTSLKSLIINTEIDMVYLLIEDDEFPYPIPDYVRPFNVTGQEFFLPGSPNYSTPWSYMELLRCALGIILPDMIGKVLWLDIDTIVDADISELFSVNLTGSYYAGVMEPKKCTSMFRYVNTGVLLINLEMLRETGKEHEMVAFLNTYKLGFPGQDVINLLCQGKVKLLDSEFNSSAYTQPCVRPKVIHYASIPKEQYMKDWAYQKYDAIKLIIGEGMIDMEKEGEQE
jgi:lipopolysaccharide biosynthesis glycosyltransferase